MKYYFKRSKKMIKLKKLTYFKYNDGCLVYGKGNIIERKIPITESEYEEFVKCYLEEENVFVIKDNSNYHKKGGLSL